MKIIISDILNLPLQANQANNELRILDREIDLCHCFGCLGCWLKTPGQCVVEDEYANMGRLLASCHDLVFVSECVYGSFSPYVKNVLDRSISYLSPYFVIRDKKMCFKRRYDNVINICAYFYGAVTEKEKDTATALLSAIALNFDAKISGAYFFDSPDEVRKALV